MPRHCCAQGCYNSIVGRDSPSHTFPRDEKVRKLWIRACQPSRPAWKPLKNDFICADHFVDDDYATSPAVLKSLGMPLKGQRLKPDAVPSVFSRKRKAGRISGAFEKRRRKELGETVQLRHDMPVDSDATAEVGAYVEINAPVWAAEASELVRAPYNGPSGYRIGTSEVMTQTEDSRMQREPQDEHAYASRWHAPTYASTATAKHFEEVFFISGTQVNLFLFKSEKRHRGTQVDLDMDQDYMNMNVTTGRGILRKIIPIRFPGYNCRIGQSSRSFSSYGRRSGSTNLR
ncbi:peroxynitrite isomerase THAP4-like isoform X2 [Dermacentor albipictus]|uniref:peroxynitrite isomerase THAP4-like isoform X2 n=1 Tax=Dermacentor albipictus TaxID=60249 RepID=UPI0031FD35FD